MSAPKRSKKRLKPRLKRVTYHVDFYSPAGRHLSTRTAVTSTPYADTLDEVASDLRNDSRGVTKDADGLRTAYAVFRMGSRSHLFRLLEALS